MPDTLQEKLVLLMRVVWMCYKYNSSVSLKQKTVIQRQFLRHKHGSISSKWL